MDITWHIVSSQSRGNVSEAMVADLFAKYERFKGNGY